MRLIYLPSNATWLSARLLGNFVPPFKKYNLVVLVSIDVSTTHRTRAPQPYLKGFKWEEHVDHSIRRIVSISSKFSSSEVVVDLASSFLKESSMAAV